MITDTELEAMGLLTDMCVDKGAPEVLSVVTDMLMSFDTDKFYGMTEEQKKEFLQPFATRIDELHVEKREPFVPAQLTGYGKKLEKKFSDLEVHEFAKGTYDGTWAFEKYIQTVEDAAGWCLLTYGGENVIAVVDEWIQDGTTEVWGLSVHELKKTLEKCFDPNQDVELITVKKPYEYAIHVLGHSFESFSNIEELKAELEKKFSPRELRSGIVDRLTSFNEKKMVDDMVRNSYMNMSVLCYYEDREVAVPRSSFLEDKIADAESKKNDAAVNEDVSKETQERF